MHVWTRVKAGTYHNFHYRWLAAIMDRLNAGVLPAGFFAMVEQIIGGPETAVLTLGSGADAPPLNPESGVVTVTAPRTRFVMPLDQEPYARKAHRSAGTPCAPSSARQSS